MKIRFDSVRKIYRTKKNIIEAVRPFNWEIEAGSVYGIIGPNGSGKTSLIRMLLDLIRPDAGVILVNDVPRGNRLAGFKQSVGYLPEERGLYQDMTALQILTYLAQLRSMSYREATTRAHALLNEIGLEEFKSSPMKSFSKGMSQKVQLLSAFIHEPQVLILDEPFTGLDPLNVKLVRNFIEKRRTSGAIILLCTHLMDEAERLCEYILMLNKGRVLHSGKQFDIRQEHKKPHISLTTDQSLNDFTTVQSIEQEGNTLRVRIQENSSAEAFIAELHDQNIQFSQLNISPARLEDIYIQSVQDGS